MQTAVENKKGISFEIPLIVLSIIKSNSKEGATAEMIAKGVPIKKHNVCGHIHTLRKDGHKINMHNGRYFLKKENINASSYSPKRERIDNDSIFNSIADKKLIAGINKINPEDIETYLDLLKKIIYYTKCAESMIATTQLMDAVRKESISL